MYEPQNLRQTLRRDRQTASPMERGRRQHGSCQGCHDRRRQRSSSWQTPHRQQGPSRDLVAKRARDAQDPLRMVIVCDMWLTGFDAPSMHTMYVDKPMQGHGLMQAIARVNRVFRDKTGGSRCRLHRHRPSTSSRRCNSIPSGTNPTPASMRTRPLPPCRKNTRWSAICTTGLTISRPWPDPPNIG